MRISKKIRNLGRRERRANPSLKSILDKQKSETIEKRQIREKAEVLWREYRSKGAEWSACVQAVKTNWVPPPFFFDSSWLIPQTDCCICKYQFGWRKLFPSRNVSIEIKRI